MNSIGATLQTYLIDYLPVQKPDINKGFEAHAVGGKCPHALLARAFGKNPKRVVGGNDAGDRRAFPNIIVVKSERLHAYLVWLFRGQEHVGRAREILRVRLGVGVKIGDDGLIGTDA